MDSQLVDFAWLAQRRPVGATSRRDLWLPPRVEVATRVARQQINRRTGEPQPPAGQIAGPHCPLGGGK